MDAIPTTLALGVIALGLLAMRVLAAMPCPEGVFC